VARRELYEELDSTQDRALDLARHGAEDGARVVARRQTKGRGRGGRRWASPPGGLYVSVVLRPPPAGALLPLALGAELAVALCERYAVRPRLKWPNDLYAVDRAGRARKLGGVLVDLVSAGGSGAAVVGVGINARRADGDLPPEVRARAVSLEELTDLPVSLDDLEELVVRAAADARRALAEPGGAVPVLARCRGLLYGLGEPVTVGGVAAGTAVGLGDDGSLVVAGPRGPCTMLSGEDHVEVGA